MIESLYLTTPRK